MGSTDENTCFLSGFTACQKTVMPSKPLQTPSTTVVILLSQETLHQLLVWLGSNQLTMMEYDNRGEAVTWLSPDMSLLSLSMSLWNIWGRLGACKCAPWYRDNLLQHLSVESPGIMQTLSAESIKRLSFSHGNGIWLQNTPLLIGIKDLDAGLSNTDMRTLFTTLTHLSCQKTLSLELDNECRCTLMNHLLSKGYDFHFK